MSIKALPYVILLGLFFVSSLVVSRFSVGQLDPTTYIGLRMLIASVMALMVYAITTGRHLPRDLELWKRAGLLGVFGTAVPMTCVVTSLQYQSSGVASLLLATGPALTVCLAHFILPDELLNRRKAIGVCLALGGAVLLALSGEDGLPDGIDNCPDRLSAGEHRHVIQFNHGHLRAEISAWLRCSGCGQHPSLYHRHRDGAVFATDGWF